MEGRGVMNERGRKEKRKGWMRKVSYSLWTVVEETP